MWEYKKKIFIEEIKLFKIIKLQPNLVGHFFKKAREVSRDHTCDTSVATELARF